MPLDRDPIAASRRTVVLAAALVIPLVIGSLAAPSLLRHLSAPPAGTPRETPRERQATSEEIAEAGRTRRELGRMEARTWGQAEFLAPQDPRPDASGEVTSRFDGFGVSVESEPSGAHVLVDGRDLGETPLVASVSCAPGARVVVRLVKPSLAPVERVTTCRRDTLVALSARLRRVRSQPR